MEIESGYCQCGCGQKTTVLEKRANKFPKGYVRKFIHGHNAIGKNNTKWKGMTISPKGYLLISVGRNLRISEQILVAEKVLGKKLPNGAVVHHVNGNKTDNTNSNLVICENESYHQIIHNRKKAFEKCGHAEWRICQRCHEYDDPKIMREFIRKNLEKQYTHFRGTCNKEIMPLQIPAWARKKLE